MSTPVTDEILLARLRSGDQAATAELAERFGAKINALAFRYLRNKEDAEEVTQDVLYRTYRKADTFRGDSALSSWIYRITFNAAMTRLRDRKRAGPRREDPAFAVDESGQATAPAVRDVEDWSNLGDEHVFRLQLRRRVFQAILGLPPIYREPVLLRDIRGMSTEEASAVLRVKGQTLKSRLHRGRTILRQQLADFAGGLSLHHALPA